MPETKSITIDFFTFGKDQQSEADISQLLVACAENGGATARESGPYIYELREMDISGRLVRGVFAKIRKDQLPHAGGPGGAERELDLAASEGLIEKNFFIYRIEDGLLIYHKNGHGSREGRMARYISDLIGETVTLNPVLQPDAARRLMRGDVEPLSITASFAKPTNVEMYPEHEWNRAMMAVMGDAGGARVAFKITSDRRSGDAGERRLADRMKDAAAALADSGLARVVRLNVMEDGIEHPIDLLADRVRSKKLITMSGRYPNKFSIFNALDEAFSDERESIYEVIGPPGNRIN